jgi:hypothetical protein
MSERKKADNYEIIKLAGTAQHSTAQHSTTRHNIKTNTQGATSGELVTLENYPNTFTLVDADTAYTAVQLQLNRYKTHSSSELV